MAAREKAHPRFAICIKADADDMLTVRKIYQVLADKGAAKSQFIRVIDDEGEDYLYPASSFVFVELPTAIEQALAHVS
jgi:hypothetical protein